MIEYFIPALLLIGFLTSYEDIKEGRIRNKHLVLGICLSTIIHALLLFFGIIEWSDALKMLLFLIFMTIISFTGWNFGLWAAGDAKLFIVMTSLIPATAYQHTTTFFPPLELMINSVTLLFGYVLFLLLFNTSKREKIASIKEVTDPKKVFSGILAILGSSWLASIILSLLGLQNDYALRFLVMLAVFQALKYLFKEKMIYLTSLLAATNIIINHEQASAPEFWLIHVSYLMIFLVGSRFLAHLATGSQKLVRIKDLKEGMLLAERITEKGTKVRIDAQTGIWKKTNTELDKKEIDRIKRMYARKKLKFHCIRTYQTIPSAIFINTAALLTLICQGNVILFLIHHI